MTEDRLNRLQRELEHSREVHHHFAHVKHDDFEWLIAEVRRLNDALRGSVVIANIAGDRIEELEDIIPELELENKFVRARNERLEQENERLEKALEFYVRKAQYDSA